MTRQREGKTSETDVGLFFLKSIMLVVLLCWASCDGCGGCRRNARELFAPYPPVTCE